MPVPNRRDSASLQFQLKPISSAGVSEALEKAARYRLLNEPSLAESICLDVLDAEPENQRALVTLLLSRTDQFGYGTAMATARELLPRLKGEYDQRYYAGIIWERSAHAQIRKGAPTASFSAFDALIQAMHCYEQAIELRLPGNDDAILRWNTCARILMRNPNLRAKPDEAYEPVTGE
jgi:hypothetical protein